MFDSFRDSKAIPLPDCHWLSSARSQNRESIVKSSKCEQQILLILGGLDDSATPLLGTGGTCISTTMISHVDAVRSYIPNFVAEQVMNR